MEINFDWLVKMDSSLIESAEEKLKKDIEDSSHFNPCHEGMVLVSILSTDPLDSTIKGNIRCTCGKIFTTFKGVSDGSKIDYFFQK